MNGIDSGAVLRTIKLLGGVDFSEAVVVYVNLHDKRPVGNIALYLTCGAGAGGIDAVQVHVSADGITYMPNRVYSGDSSTDYSDVLTGAAGIDSWASQLLVIPAAKMRLTITPAAATTRTLTADLVIQ